MMTDTEIEDSKSSRIAITEANGETVIVIPPKRPMYLVVFVTFWLTAWTYAGIEGALSYLAADARFGGQSSLGLWLCGWLLGEFVAGRALVRMFFSLETVTASRSVLKLTRTLLFLSHSKVYSSAFITNMRWQMVRASENDNKTQLSFDYAGEKIGFAGGCDEAEGQHIISILTHRLNLNRARSLAAQDQSEAA